MMEREHRFKKRFNRGNRPPESLPDPDKIMAGLLETCEEQERQLAAKTKRINQLLRAMEQSKETP